MSGLTYTRPRRRRVRWGSVANRPNYEQNAAACRWRPEIDIYSAGHRYRVLAAFTGSERNYSFAQIRRRAKWNLTLDPMGLHLGYPSCKGSMQSNCNGESKLCKYFELTEKTLQCQFQAIPSQRKSNFAEQHPRRSLTQQPLFTAHPGFLFPRLPLWFCRALSSRFSPLFLPLLFPQRELCDCGFRILRPENSTCSKMVRRQVSEL